MTRNARWMGAALVGGLLLGASPAGAADFRWPWEKPKDNKEKVEQKDKVEQKGKEKPALKTTPAPEFTGRAEDREMLPRLATFYGKQLDLADRAVASTTDPEVKRFAGQLQRQSENALGIINERARKIGLSMKPHIRASLAERLNQSGRNRDINVKKQAGKVTDQEVLQSLMENIQQIRPDFAAYKEGADRETSQQLAKLFDDELVPNYDKAKSLHDRVRNEARERNREGQ
jgi:hypothetical protein